MGRARGEVQAVEGGAARGRARGVDPRLRPPGVQQQLPHADKRVPEHAVQRPVGAGEPPLRVRVRDPAAAEVQHLRQLHGGAEARGARHDARDGPVHRHGQPRQNLPGLRRKLSERPAVEWHANKEDLRLALSISIKMADISNCGRPSKLYLEWAKNIASEFYVQGDAEAKLCLAISPFMDRSKDQQEFPKGQISFMNFVVIPMFEAISEFLPNMEFCLKHCTENKEYWQALDG